MSCNEFSSLWSPSGAMWAHSHPSGSPGKVWVVLVPSLWLIPACASPRKGQGFFLPWRFSASGPGLWHPPSPWTRMSGQSWVLETGFGCFYWLWQIPLNSHQVVALKTHKKCKEVLVRKVGLSKAENKIWFLCKPKSDLNLPQNSFCVRYRSRKSNFISLYLCTGQYPAHT